MEAAPAVCPLRSNMDFDFVVPGCARSLGIKGPRPS
jgi:hypothetical protein